MFTPGFDGGSLIFHTKAFKFFNVRFGLATVEILVKPKNALVKQYQKLFGMEDVELVFSEDALAAIAKIARKRETGARGLRSVIEDTMLHIMYEIPSNPNIRKVVVTADTILKNVLVILMAALVTAVSWQVISRSGKSPVSGEGSATSTGDHSGSRKRQPAGRSGHSASRRPSAGVFCWYQLR